MAVVVVGDIDPELAEKKIMEYFGRIPKAVNPPQRVEFPVPANNEPLISVVTDKEASGFDATIFFKHPKSDNVTFGDYRNQLNENIVYRDVKQPTSGDWTKTRISILICRSRIWFIYREIC